MRGRKSPGWRLLALFLVSGCGLLGQPSTGSISRLQFLGQARIAAGLRMEETEVGGLSGITFDASRGLFYVVADDPGARAPARFYAVEIDLEDERLTEDGARVVGMTVIQAPEGGPMPRLSADPEGIALDSDGNLYISSEGQIRQQVAPFVRRFTRDGDYLGELALPLRYRPSEDGTAGPRHNLGFESLTVTPDGRFLFTAMENALVQDGPEAALGIASPSRLLKYRLRDGAMMGEFVYRTEPLAAPSSVPDGVEVNGLVDLLALDALRLLSLERSFSMGVGNTIKLFLIDLAAATDVRALPALNDVDPDGIVPIDKQLLLNLSDLGIYLDNLEGMTFGPPLGDGRRTLILVSDDNFNPLVQTTQFLAFGLGEGPVGVEDLQGAAHRSPLEGHWVRDVEGVVTGNYPGQETGFWMETADDDGDPATSRGVLVLHGEEISTSPGEAVVVDGRVEETGSVRDLGTTTLRASRIRFRESGPSPLPPPVSVGAAGLRVPAEVMDDDGLRVFEPRFDGLDFWESLEGMRVVLVDAPVVGPTNRFGDLAVDASGDPMSGASTRVGGLLLRPGDLNPERLTVEFSGPGEPPIADVGARFTGGLVGVVGYDHSSYRLYAQNPLPGLESAGRRPENTDLTPGEDRLTVATFNVFNLSARSHDDRYEALARALTVMLQSPDIVALQEIQDDTGPVDDGTVTAARTLQRLIDAVARSGGPDYDYLQIDPVDNGDGGQPGSNIRLAFLFNPGRVSPVERGPAGPSDAVRLVRDADGVGLSANPGRIAPGAPAFSGDDARGFSAGRKPLVAEFHYGNQRLFVVNNHFSSKGSDDPAFGAVQPPVRHSEDQRSQQARLVADFVVELLEMDPGAGIVVLGDLNDHEFRTPLRVLPAARLENLVWQLQPEDRYSYNYRGNSQLLDHILVSRPLLERARVRFDIVHANSDLAHARSSSDHDPMVVELDFGRTD